MDPFTFLGIDLNSPLNQAHYQERLAERYLKDKSYDNAIIHFERASQLMTEAAAMVPKNVKSLQLQAEKLHRMQQVVHIKKKEEENRLQSKSELSLQNNIKSPASSSEEDSPSQTPPGQLDARWQFVPQNLQHWIEENETDSLLQFLNVHGTEDKHDKGGRKIDADAKSKIEALDILNKELKNLILRLMEELEKKEKENRSLSQTVETLRSEVWSLTARLQDISLEDDDLVNESEGLHSINFESALAMQEHAGYDPMVSSLIVQPQSFFVFDGGDKNLIQSALDEDGDSTISAQTDMRFHPDIRGSPLSVRYEDMEEIGIEGCDTGTPKLSKKKSENKRPCNATDHAGLPPLSPAHHNIALDSSDEDT